MASYCKESDLISVNHDATCFVLEQNRVSEKLFCACDFVIFGFQQLFDIVLSFDVRVLFSAQVLHDFAETLSLFLSFVDNKHKRRVVFVDRKWTSRSSWMDVCFVYIKQNAVLRRTQRHFVFKNRSLFVS